MSPPPRRPSRAPRALQCGGTGPGRSARSGFTLLEMLAAVAVAGVLTTAGWPWWRAQLQRAHRLDALEALLRVQTAQERHRDLHGRYAAVPAALGLGGSGGDAAFRSRQGHWRVALRTDGAEAYVATATATDAAAAAGRCGQLTLQVVRGFPAEGPEAACWGR